MLKIIRSKGYIAKNWGESLILSWCYET
jgi:hypothetical protein